MQGLFCCIFATQIMQQNQELSGRGAPDCKLLILQHNLMLAIARMKCDNKITAKEIAMADKSIETRIREYYVSESGEWLVEKGKVKEAKLLKEACETVERLRSENARLWQNSKVESRNLYDREQAILKWEKGLQEIADSLHNRLESAAKGLQYLMEKVK